MPRVGLTHDIVIEKAAELANRDGAAGVTIATLASYLGVKKPSLYNHISSQDDIYNGLMLYGWKAVSSQLVEGVSHLKGEAALSQYARDLYHFAIKNPGVFEAMLWYNKYRNEELRIATEGLYNFFFEQTSYLGIDDLVANHLLRTYRAFLEGFSLLVIHDAFGNPVSIDESFELSLKVLIEGIKPFEKGDK